MARERTASLVRDARLVALLPRVKPRELSVHAVYATRKRTAPAVRAMPEFLAERFAPEPEWDT